MTDNKQKKLCDKRLENNSIDENNNREIFQQSYSEVEKERITQNTKNLSKKEATGADKKLIITGLIMIAVFLLAMIFTPTSPTVTEDEVNQALKEHMSTNLPIGALLCDEEYYEGQDITIIHSSNSSENKIYVWDYCAEDGDYVQILVDGVAICDSFMIKNDPVAFTVPTTGEIQVLGIRDGGGGITYAIYYEVNGTSYYNGTNVGKGNLYTLIRK